ncbi:MAG TPA: hypothetical protein VIF57_11275 [Polyangia bacterium]
MERIPPDPGDSLDEDERALLHETLRESERDVVAGRLIDAEDLLRELWSVSPL